MRKKDVGHTHTMWVCFVRCAFLFKISWAGWNWQVWRYQENYMFMLYHDLRKEYLELFPHPSLFSCRCVEKQKTWIMAKYEPNGHPIRYGYHALLPSFSKTPVYSISFWWAKLGNLWIKHINRLSKTVKLDIPDHTMACLERGHVSSWILKVRRANASIWFDLYYWKMLHSVAFSVGFILAFCLEISTDMKIVVPWSMAVYGISFVDAVQATSHWWSESLQLGCGWVVKAFIDPVVL